MYSFPSCARFASLSPDSFYLTQDVIMARSQVFSAMSPVSRHTAMKVSSADEAEPWQSGTHSRSWRRLWTAWGSSELTGSTSLWFIIHSLVVVKLEGNGHLIQFTSERMLSLLMWRLTSQFAEDLGIKWETFFHLEVSICSLLRDYTWWSVGSQWS